MPDDAYIILFVAAPLVGAVFGRPRMGPPWLMPIVLGLAWFAFIMVGTGSFFLAAVGITALLPVFAGKFVAGHPLMLRVATFVVSFALFTLAHGDRLGSLSDIALMAAIGVGMLAFVLRSPETDRVPGIEGAHLCTVALGAVVIAIDMQQQGAALALPGILASMMAVRVLQPRPIGSTSLGYPTADVAALLVAFLLGDMALAGAWGPALVLGSVAALEITILLATAARADRSNDKDRARGVFVEAMARQRGERKALVGTIVVGVILAVLALGASMDEWIAALLGAGALMWLFQRYLWRLVPERRPH